MAELSKSLGVIRGTALMLNIVLGAGLLTLPGLAVQQVGSDAPLVWIACALAAAPLLWVFAVLGRRHPDAGGIAAIMDHAFGQWGRISATLLFLGAVSVGLPAIALTGGHYISAALGGPSWIHAMGLIIVALAINFLSAEIAGKINTFMSSLILVFLVGLAGVSWFIVSRDAPAASTVMIAPPDLHRFGLTFMMVFFAFTGWEVSANLGAEFRNPHRDLPRTMALSFAIAVVLYLALAAVVARSGEMGAGPAPFAKIFGNAFGWEGTLTISAIAVLLILANLSAAIWAVSRMVYSAAQEGLLPGAFTRIRRDVPLKAVMATVFTLLSVIIMVHMGLLDLSRILAMAGQNFLLLYAGSAAALMRLEPKRTFRIVSLFCLAIVGVLLIGRGTEGMVYPVALFAIGFVLIHWRRPKQKRDNTG